MGKNIGIGGKKKKQGKKFVQTERELQFAEEMQQYGQTLRLLGDSRLEIQCLDGVKRMGHIRGKMRKKVWIALGDVVLVALREYEDDKCDIILKYTEDEVRKLKSEGEIPESIKLPENENKAVDETDDINFVGADEDDSDEEEGNNNNKKNNNKKNNKKEVSDSEEENSQDDELDINNI